MPSLSTGAVTPQGAASPTGIGRVAVLGIGLIGSSIAHALRRTGPSDHLTGYDGSADVRQRAEAIGVFDTIAGSACEAVRDADIIFLCVPVGAMAELVGECSTCMKPGAILTDVGSVKAAVMTRVGPLVPQGVHFIPGHPIAGTEHSGPEAGFAELFDGRWCVLTPPPDADDGAVEKMRSVWQLLGSDVEIMLPEHHDLVLAITSHLPHLIAFNIVGTAADLEEVTKSEVIKFSAGGFRDFTRIAASDPVMWRDVFLNNKDAVLETLGRFTEDLAALQRAIRWGDGEALYSLFARTREIRRGIIEAGQETRDADFGRKRAEAARQRQS